MAIRLLALDLDGTVLSDEERVSTRVRAVLERARQRGIHVTLASGRGFPSLRHWAGELGVTAPLICYQGAMVVDPQSEQVLYRSTFPLSLAAEAVDFARARGLSLTLYVDDVIYVEKMLHSDEFYQRWFGLPYHLVDDLATALPDAPTKFILIDTKEVLDAVRPDLERHFAGRLQIVRSHALFLEGLAHEATKGNALAFVAERLGIARQDTMAIGDSGNDVSMIAWAGVGVAMGNASDEARAVADWVAPAIGDDGAAEAIERFCLEE